MTLTASDISQLSERELAAKYGLDVDTARYLKLTEEGGQVDVVGYKDGKFPTFEADSARQKQKSKVQSQ